MRASDGTAVGGVVGVFAQGPLAGRLRVEGVYSALRYRGRPQERIAVYAIPRHAVRRRRDSLVLNVPLSQARARWLVHVREPQGP